MKQKQRHFSFFVDTYACPCLRGWGRACWHGCSVLNARNELQYARWYICNTQCSSLFDSLYFLPSNTCWLIVLVRWPIDMLLEISMCFLGLLYGLWSILTDYTMSLDTDSPDGGWDRLQPSLSHRVFFIDDVEFQVTSLRRLLNH